MFAPCHPFGAHVPNVARERHYIYRMKCFRTTLLPLSSTFHLHSCLGISVSVDSIGDQRGVGGKARASFPLPGETDTFQNNARQKAHLGASLRNIR